MDAARSASTSTEAARTRCATARVRSLRGTRSLEHPGVVAADDGFDLVGAEVARRPDGAAQAEGQARDVGDFPEAVAVLEEERLPVDLDELAAIGRGRGHAASVSERAAQSGGSPGSPGSSAFAFALGCAKRAAFSSAFAVDVRPATSVRATTTASNADRITLISTTLPIVGAHRCSVSCTVIMATEPKRSMNAGT